MFDFGNDDKEKLRENMEQIKDMVNEGKGIGQEQQPQEGFSQGFEEEQEIEYTGGGFEEGFEEQNEGQQPGDERTHDFDQPGQDTPQEAAGFDSPQEEEVEQELDEFEQKFGDEEQQPRQAQDVDNTAPNTPPPNQQRSRSTQEGVTDSRGTEQLSREVPSPPETRELNVPDIDRGPLFLRQRKFLRAKQMIEDMLYLSEEMEKTVNNLEAGLQEDKDIERDVVEILREFEDNRTEVEDIISPREE